MGNNSARKGDETPRGGGTLTALPVGMAEASRKKTPPVPDAIDTEKKTAAIFAGIEKVERKLEQAYEKRSHTLSERKDAVEAVQKARTAYDMAVHGSPEAGELEGALAAARTRQEAAEMACDASRRAVRGFEKDLDVLWAEYEEALAVSDHYRQLYQKSMDDLHVAEDAVDVLINRVYAVLNDEIPEGDWETGGQRG